MRSISFCCGLWLSLGAAACSGNGASDVANSAATNTSSSRPTSKITVPAQTYAGSGTVKALGGNSITISHGPIEAKGWPAMTMAFVVPTSELLRDTVAGDRVAFEFRDAPGGPELTAISRLR